MIAKAFSYLYYRSYMQQKRIYAQNSQRIAEFTMLFPIWIHILTLNCLLDFTFGLHFIPYGHTNMGFKIVLSLLFFIGLTIFETRFLNKRIPQILKRFEGESSQSRFKHTIYIWAYFIATFLLAWLAFHLGAITKNTGFTLIGYLMEKQL